MGLSKKLFANEILHLDPVSYLRERSKGVRISATPVFIVGCGHSGTTMLRHLLGMHNNIYAVPYESRIFFHSDLKIRMSSAIWNFTAISKGKTRWVEKTPSHIHHIDKALEFFPGSRILLLIRDGRNVAVSLRKRWGNFERAVRRWINDNRSGEKYWDHPGVMKLQYEHLVGDFEEQARAICEFIEEPFDNNLLDFANRTASSRAEAEIIIPEGAKPAKYRHRQIEKGLYKPEDKWVSQMTSREKVVFKQMAGEMLIKYGYADDNHW